MQELRFIAADDAALIVSDEAGEQYRVIVDDALRDALRPRPHVRAEAPRVAPREIQQLIRSGRTVDEVIELTGAERSDVERFEGPVRAERAHIVNQARLVRVRVQPDADPLDPDAATFGSVIDDRLEALGAASIEWDAWKDPEEGWRIGLEFAVEGISRDALWAYDPRARALSPRNPAAVTLSQQGELSSLQAPRLRAVEPELPDFAGSLHEPGETQPTDPASQAASSGPEARNGESPVPSRASDPRGAGWVGAAVADIGQQRTDSPRDETADLLEQLRRRRGERTHQPFEEFDDETGDPLDAAHGELGDGVEPDGGELRPAAPSTVTSLSSVRERSNRTREGTSTMGLDDTGAEADETPGTEGSGPDEAVAPPTGAGRVRAVDVPLDGFETSDDSPRHSSRTALVGRGTTGPVSRKRGRASLPSWDEIVFGTRSDD
ncbi:hypothetical protein GCM10011490_04600 [Pseudoclavibacter endophyticus]|nr:septation protein SepH [Pseudoclavibacter endophyticus]GGA57817.1 hypothetical protein GCM10011490_04600 [Pseudoclavibacter endophyticus]